MAAAEGPPVTGTTNYNDALPYSDLVAERNERKYLTKREQRKLRCFDRIMLVMNVLPFAGFITFLKTYHNEQDICPGGK